MKCSDTGNVWLEVLLAVAVFGILLVSGITALNRMLEAIRMSIQWELEQREILDLGRRIQRMTDQRSENLFRSRPVIEGAEGPNGWELSEYSVEWFDNAGILQEWKLSFTMGQWVESGQEEDGQPAKRILNYGGRIWLRPAGAESITGAGLLLWRFPDARFQRSKDGFAIHRFW